jgi:glycosyltransferase involved in cell wall biosynthesis
MAPVVSVIMATFNRSRYLPESIESVLSQTLTDFEFIIIDDHSVDESWNILVDYANRDQRIVLIRNSENVGISKSRNAGLAVAQGIFMAVMDSDDIALPERLELQVEYLKQHPDCVAVGSEVLLVDPEGWPLGLKGQDINHEAIEQTFLNGRGGAIVHPSSMIRASTLAQIGGYNPNLPVSLDYDLFIRLAEVGKLANLPQVLLKFRQHFNRVSDSQRDLQLQLMQDILSPVWLKRGLGNLPQKLLEGPRLLTPAERLEDWIRRSTYSGYFITSAKHLWALFLHQPLSFRCLKLFLFVMKSVVKKQIPFNLRKT